jgi:hypothetical protein
MATITAQPVSLTGAAVTQSAAATAIDFVVPSTASVVFVRVVAGGGTAIGVLVDDPNTAGPIGANAFDPDLALSVASATTKCFALRTAEINRFRNQSTGKITLALSGTLTSSFVEVTYL